MTSNWRVPVDAGDYFGQEKKRVDIEQRRPVIRRASDLVGPGIAASAVRVTDWSDTLATFNGYYASLPGAASAPNETEAFLGFTVMDAEVGGKQVVTSMTSGVEYTRIFRRNPADADSILWDVWAPARDKIAATVESVGPVATTVPTGVATDLLMPSIESIGDASVWQVAGARLNITQPGVYTGHLIVSDGVPLTNLTLTHPSLSGPLSNSRTDISAYGDKWLPFTFAATTSDQYVTVNVTQATGVSQSVSITALALTRTSQI